jgi:hypothetical protein
LRLFAITVRVNSVGVLALAIDRVGITITAATRAWDSPSSIPKAFQQPGASVIESAVEAASRSVLPLKGIINGIDRETIRS